MAISQDTLNRHFERGARLKLLQGRIHEYAHFVQEAHDTRAAQESLTMPLEKMLETAYTLLPRLTELIGKIDEAWTAGIERDIFTAIQ